jgi:hypothetical protein
VIETLVEVGEFSELADSTTASIVQRAVDRQVRRPDAAFECIVDNLALSNWRLRPGHDGPALVRLSCWRVSPTPADDERKQRVNLALDQLSL